MYAVQPPRYQPDTLNWQDCRRYLNISQTPHKSLSPSVRQWLLDPGSLTQRLIKASGGQFQVQVLSQQWGQPRLSEARLLNMRHREIAIIREVALLCAEMPWVFARSIIPASSLTGYLRRLRKFDNSSLGEMLFRDKSMRRHPFQLTTIKGDSYQIPAHLHTTGKLWGRRCRFELANKPIMVSEIFLDTFRP